MKKQCGVDPSFLRKVLRYDPDLGVLFWLTRSADTFVNNRYVASANADRWNRRYAGKPALNASCGQGYVGGSICGKKYKAHHVVWAFVYGKWPEGHIDHINGDRADNRICNLRVVSHSENQRNRARAKNNTSGVTGVYWYKSSEKWQALIMHNKKLISLGSFERFEDAVQARKQAEARFGYHENHDRAA